MTGFSSREVEFFQRVARIIKSVEHNPASIRNAMIHMKPHERAKFMEIFIVERWTNPKEDTFAAAKRIAMENSNAEEEIWKTVNETPGMTYDILKQCPNVKEMKWAVEVMKLNPLAVSNERKVYSRWFSPTMNPNYMSGRTRSIFSIPVIDPNDTRVYLCGPNPSTDEEDYETVKDEIVWHFITSGHDRNIIQYLLEKGAADEILYNQKTRLNRHNLIMTCKVFFNGLFFHSFWMGSAIATAAFISDFTEFVSYTEVGIAAAGIAALLGLKNAIKYNLQPKKSYSQVKNFLEKHYA